MQKLTQFIVGLFQANRVVRAEKFGLWFIVRSFLMLRVWWFVFVLLYIASVAGTEELWDDRAFGKEVSDILSWGNILMLGLLDLFLRLRTAKVEYEFETDIPHQISVPFWKRPFLSDCAGFKFIFGFPVWIIAPIVAYRVFMQ